jgi:hypothetical protein
MDSSGSGYGQVAGSCENSNNLPGPIKERDVIGQLWGSQFAKKDFPTINLQHKNAD